MVNYCCVRGCGRNSKTSKHLFYYGVPKDNPRQEKWLRAIGREDLLERNLKNLLYRVCSRHFAPSSLKNKHLCADAIPTLCLPGDDFEEPDNEQTKLHNEIACNSCEKVILGYRYKCITCPDYDLCARCEMLGTHSDHYMIRFPRPVDFKVADNLIKKWQYFANIEHVTVDSHNPICDASSDDDVPITKLLKNDKSAIDLPEDIKTKIRGEVTRILAIKHIEPKKRKKKEPKRNYKKPMLDTQEKGCGTEDLEKLFPDVAFADVNNITKEQMLEIKDEIPTNLTPLIETHQPVTDINFCDADFMLS